MDILQQTDSTKKKSRRPGTGSIKARSKGTYLVRYSGPSANGKRKQVNITVKGSHKYAEQILRDRLEVFFEEGREASEHTPTLPISSLIIKATYTEYHRP